MNTSPNSFSPRPAVCLLVSALPLPAAQSSGAAADFRRPHYTVLRAGTPIVIDGRLDEPAWFAAPHVGDFHFPWYQEGRKEGTRAKMLWNDEYLYVAFVCEDAHITARHTERDGKIFEDDCVEVMVAPNLETPEIYFNIEFNLLGGILDNHRPHGPERPRAPKWDAVGVVIAGTHAGTLNNDSDIDRHWIVEAAIPFRNFRTVAGQERPRSGTGWNLSLNRHGGRTPTPASGRRGTVQLGGPFTRHIVLAGLSSPIRRALLPATTGSSRRSVDAAAGPPGMRASTGPCRRGASAG
jgi:hypothetical protein